MIKVIVIGVLAAFAFSAASATAFGQKTRQQSGSWRKANGNQGGWNRQATTQPGRRDIQTGATDARGRTASHGRTVEKTGPGTAHVSTQSTGFGGRSIQTQGTATRTTEGSVSSGAYTTGGGRTGSYETVVTREDGVRQVDTQYTTSQGQTGRVSRTQTRGGGAGHQLTTVTGPNGRSRTGAGSATVR
jgi:hypothetical protein